jgi:predicted lipoprotein with Yx(FWY)xxD motif
MTVTYACTIAVAVAAAAAGCGASEANAPAEAPATSAANAANAPSAQATPPATGVATAAPTPARRRGVPVAIRDDRAFGPVLVTRDRRALYTWAPERADHRIHCTGGCAALWPPLVVAPGTRLAYEAVAGSAARA